MAEARLTITNPHGLHARPAAEFVRAAGRFSSTIKIRNLSRQTRDVDAKSLISLMTLGIAQGHEILLSAEGPDADEAVARLRALLEGHGQRPHTGADKDAGVGAGG